MIGTHFWMKTGKMGEKEKRQTDSVVCKIRTRVFSDLEIVEGIASGVPAAAEALVDRYGKSINRRVWRLLGADGEHADVVQNVYAQIFKSICRLRDPKALPDWIVKTTVSVVRNELRRRKIRRIVSFVEKPGHDLPGTADLDEQLRLRRAVAVLNKMNVDDRIIFVMRYVEGAGFNEIAVATGASLATVKRRVPRARETFLKKAMRDPFLASVAMEEGNDDQ